MVNLTKDSSFSWYDYAEWSKKCLSNCFQCKKTLHHNCINPEECGHN